MEFEIDWIKVREVERFQSDDELEFLPYSKLEAS
jgi:hypothetical protein